MAEVLLTIEKATGNDEQCEGHLLREDGPRCVRVRWHVGSHYAEQPEGVIHSGVAFWPGDAERMPQTVKDAWGIK